MTIARFSPFELLLLNSRHPVDTAALLMLGWVLVCRGPVGEAERKRLAELTRDFRHGHALAPILQVAASRDLGAVQLAAEVLSEEAQGEQARDFLRLAVTLAAEEGRPSIANQHVLRFFADLLGVPPAEFAPLFKAVTGKPLGAPPDPSRQAYWRSKEHAGQERERREQQAREERERQEREREARRQRQQREQEQRQRRQEQAHARRERERQEQAHRERERQEQARRERERQQQRDPGTRRPPAERTRRALAVLGLEPGASRVEIRRAYRRLAQAHHPDRFFHEGEAVVATASQRFQRIRRAYDFLMEVG